ncbi:MJ1244 family protein [Methanocaldococcus sp.]
MKILLYLFVESENLGKALNALSEGEITGYFLMDYKGMSPQDWKGFLLDEDPEMAIKAVNDLSQNAVMIGTVVDDKKILEIEKIIDEKLNNCKYTIIEIPLEGIIVNMVKDFER